MSTEDKSLVLDFGNTRDKYALFKGREMIGAFEPEARLDLAQLRSLLERERPREAILSNTGAERPDLLEWLSGQLRLLELSHLTPLPFKMDYATPESLGRDRIALAAAICTEPLPALAIDAGTCITLELLDAHGQYRGGVISPGMNMRLQAMHTFTAKLPLLRWESGMDRPLPLGNSTQNCMLAGAVIGAAAEFDGWIDRYREQFGALRVLISGGDAEVLAASMKNRIFAAPHLLMHGLNNILIYNALDRS